MRACSRILRRFLDTAPALTLPTLARRAPPSPARGRGILALALLLFFATTAAATELTGAFTQGGLVHGRTEPGSAVTLDERAVPISPAGDFVIGFGREAAPQASLVIRHPEGEPETRILEIAKREWAIRRVDGLPQETVTPDPAQLARINEEGAEIRALRGAPSQELGFTQTMIWPAVGPISGVYGSQSILNGQPRAPHMGVDIAAPPGTAIVAPADGIVRLGKPYFLTGYTILLDHGYGLFTSYAHLSRIDVVDGQRVQQGERLGAIGATGRATGPHLHWGMEWFEVRLDPALVVPPMISPASGDAATATSPDAP